MEVLGLKVSDILIAEVSSITRIEVPATTGLKAGQLVDYPLRGQKLVALTDERNGTVQIQPHNCIINLAYTPMSEIQAAFAVEAHSDVEGNVMSVGNHDALEALQKAGDNYGVMYRGTPKP